MTWLSEHEHVMSRGHFRQRIRCDPETSRKHQRTLPWTATVLTITRYNVIPSIWESRAVSLRRQDDSRLVRQINKDGGGAETLVPVREVGKSRRRYSVGRLMTTVAYFQADTSDSENKSSPHLPRATIL